MSSITPLQKSEIDFLQPFLPKNGTPQKPFVTITYASGLDGLISISPAFRTIISGPETKSMTHYLRSNHDAILVGEDTARFDDPALNCRYSGVNPDRQPQPVIISSLLSWNPTGKQVVKLSQQGKGKKPWIIHKADTNIPKGYPQDDVELIAIRSSSRYLGWVDILAALRSKGISSIMIEGGASILSSLLKRPEIVDAVVVTVAPTWLGADENGSSKQVVPYRTTDDGQRNAATLENVSWLQFGRDMVLCGTLQQKS